MASSSFVIDTYNPFVMGGVVMNGMSRSVGCEFFEICLDYIHCIFSCFERLYVLNLHPLSRVTSESIINQHPIFEDQILNEKNAEKSRKHLLRRALTLSIRSRMKFACGADRWQLCEPSALLIVAFIT